MRPGATRAELDMNSRIVFWPLLITVFVGLVALLTSRVNEAQTNPVQATSNRCDMAFPLSNPSDIGTKKFEKLLYAFLEIGCYKSWVADARMRNTGPFIGGQSLGTHNAVKVYYSPEVWDWLKRRNRQGEISDGAMIVKEMFPSPAREGSKLSAWTVMVIRIDYKVRKYPSTLAFCL